MQHIETDGFEATAAPCRRELLAHCYRMTGSVREADDLAQEAYRRARRDHDPVEHPSSVRAGLYRAATEVCLSALERGRRRCLPSGIGPPSPDPYGRAEQVPPGLGWVEPIPDRLVLDGDGPPAQMVAARQSVGLDLVAALQLLPARQRAAYVLCEFQGLQVAEAAALIGVSPVAAKSLLQRARARLARVPLGDDGPAGPTGPDGLASRRVLDRAMAAFEESDLATFERLLADDAVTEMTGTSTWFSGRTNCLAFTAARVIGRPGDWRMVPTRANGLPAAGAYQRRPGGGYHPFAVIVLATTSTHLRRISFFADPVLFTHFSLPAVLRG